MFIWMTTLFTILTFPIFLFFAKNPKAMLAKKWLPDEINKAFPVSSRTPIFVTEPREWLGKFMDKIGISGWAFLGVICLRTDDARVKRHECVHIVQQSCFSPLLVGLIYLQEIGVFIPFRKYWPKGHWKYTPVLEKVAYKIAEDRDV